MSERNDAGPGSVRKEFNVDDRIYLFGHSRAAPAPTTWLRNTEYMAPSARRTRSDGYDQ